VSSPGALDLGRRRDLSSLLRTTLAVYRARWGTVLIVAASIVIPVDLIIGAGLNQITSTYQAHPRNSVGAIEVLASLFVLSPLINATHAQLLLDLGEGRAPDPRRLIQRGLDVFAPALLAVALYWAAVFAGALLIFPGIYVYVLWYLTTQAVVIEGRRGFGALQRSGELVSGHWFRVLAVVVVINLVGALPAVGLAAAVDAAARAANAQVITLVGAMIVQVLLLSFLALSAGLLFFDLRVGQAAGPAKPPAR
jgi:hypothetical protein